MFHCCCETELLALLMSWLTVNPACQKAVILRAPVTTADVYSSGGKDSARGEQESQGFALGFKSELVTLRPQGRQ